MHSRRPPPTGRRSRLSRRAFFGRALGAAAGSAAAACGRQSADAPELPEPRRPPPRTADVSSWDGVRAQFPDAGGLVQMSALFIASHPAAVREAIARYRTELDERPVGTLQEHNPERRARVLEAAARYLGAEPDEIALTDSTTMGLGLVYGGLRLDEGDEILTTEQDYYVTHEALRLAARRSGARVRRVSLYDDLARITPPALADRLTSAISDRTRVVALTWVHSSTGLKLPLAEIGRAVRARDARRPASRRLLLCVDAVHGFGVEPVSVRDLGCDFFVAGCHKWLFGPRGTGLVWGRRESWPALHPHIPTFADGDVWAAWMRGEDPRGRTTASRMTPGGFKAFEHQWAMADAFGFHEGIGPARVRDRTHALSRALKEGLQAMGHVRLVTPSDPALAAGIVCFDVARLSPWEAVRRLREDGIVATVTPYAVRHVRLTPSIRNSDEDVSRALRAVGRLA
jgi:selenocysteine lyase/cysteine desulfurase